MRDVEQIRRMRTWARSGLFLCGLLCCPLQLPAQDFVLSEHLGRTWNRELVTFPITAAQQQAMNRGYVLVGPDGQPVPVQLTEVAGKPRIAFQATLPPGSTQNYRLVPGPSVVTTDLWMDDTGPTLRFGNAHIGISLHKTLPDRAAPIESVRLRSGTWTSASILSGGSRVADYRLELLADGPVFIEVLCRVVFSDAGEWLMRLRVLREEPVILIREDFDAPGGGRVLLPLGGEGFRPDRILYRKGKGQLGRLDSWPISPAGVDDGSATAESWLRGWLNFSKGTWAVNPVSGEAFTLEPWLRWWLNERQGNWFAVYRGTGSSGEFASHDLLMAAALKPAEWQSVDWEGRAGQVEPLVTADIEQGVVVLQLPLGGGARNWMLGTPPLDESLQPLSAGNTNMAPMPQSYVIKYGDFPLEEVKDYVLDWPGAETSYPHLFIGQKDLPQLRDSLAVEASEIERWTSRQPIDKYNIEAPLIAWFSSGDEALGQAIVKRSEEWLDRAVFDDLLEQNGRVTLGVAPHNQAVSLLPTLNLTDAALACECLTPGQRRRMRAQIAFLAYAVNRDDYWSPERGYAANPNMTTTVALFRTALAALIPTHPESASWAERGLRELRRELYEWSDEDGGWLEAPHYAMVSFDHILGGFVMASNAGFGDDVHDPRLRKVIEWMAKISTPPDWRIGGFRHFPPIGNTYVGETTGMFGIVAGLWKDRDPLFAANMQWMSDQHGWPDIGLLGAFGTFTGYQSLLRANGVKPQPPDYGSEWFRDTGVVLRNTFDSDRETWLYLIAGSQHEHYDFDSGSIVIWGKGSLLSNDFGYIGRHSAEWHSQVTSGAIGPDSVMQVEAFSTTPALDFVEGKKDGWRRQIALLKDNDPMGPTGILIRDHESPGAIWRLWLTGTGLDLNERGATLTGIDDIDLEVYFYQPETLALSTEATVQKGKGRRGDRVGPVDLPQTALVAGPDRSGTVTAFLYPRLKTESAPKVSWFADGAGIRLETYKGIDYLFLARNGTAGAELNHSVPGSDADAESLKFNCAVCSVQLRDGRVTLSLGSGGRVSFGDKMLEAAEPGSIVLSRSGGH